MSNEQNLKPFTKDQNSESAVINGRKGGIASGEAKRRKKLFKEILEQLLDEEVVNTSTGEKVTKKEAMTISMITKVMKHGDVRAFEVLRDTMGEKPVEKREIVAKITPTQADEFESLVKSMME